MKHIGAVFTFLIAALCQLGQTSAFELTPLPTNVERKLAQRANGIKFRLKYPVVDFAMHRFADPVHEALTHLAFECPLHSLADCGSADTDVAPTAVIVGVRWNDDPPFQFVSGSGRYRGCPGPIATISFTMTVSCWLQHFRDVSRRANKNPSTYLSGKGTLLARTHFGDLQFLHAMANSTGIPAELTKRKLMMWSEFMWRLVNPGPERIKGHTKMGKVPVDGMRLHFPPGEERTVEDLFTLGRPWMRSNIRDIAFGSFLHVVQDSFSGSHVTRRPRTDPECGVSEIVEFHSYPGQDKDDHKQYDSLRAAELKIMSQDGVQSLLNVQRELVNRRNNDQSWNEIQPYLENCVFRLAIDARPSTASVKQD